MTSDEKITQLKQLFTKWDKFVPGNRGDYHAFIELVRQVVIIDHDDQGSHD